MIGPLLPKSAIDTQRVKIVGTGGWDYPNAGRERILEGGWFAAPDPRGWREFSERFAKSYKTMPPRLASLAYDAVGIATDILDRAARRAATRPANLTRASGFTGVDGAFPIARRAASSERDLAILEMQKFGYERHRACTRQPRDRLAALAGCTGRLQLIFRAAVARANR